MITVESIEMFLVGVLFWTLVAWIGTRNYRKQIEAEKDIALRHKAAIEHLEKLNDLLVAGYMRERRRTDDLGDEIQKLQAQIARTHGAAS